MTVTEKTRRLVYERDEGCVAAGTLPGPCRGGRTIQHIVGRGMGGSHRYDTPEWLVQMCAHHNVRIEQDVATARAAAAAGLTMRRSTAARTLHAVVRYPDGRWYALNDTGGRVEWEPFPVIS